MFLLRASSTIAAAVILLACIKPNPAFDDAADSASASDSAGPTSPTSGPTTQPTSASTDTGGSASAGQTTTAGPSSGSDSLTTTTDLSASSGGPHCGTPGEPCAEGCCAGCGVCMNGTCVADDAQCGACHSCGPDGQCVPVTAMTPCQLARDPCADKVWGLADGTCFANAPGTGSCDAGGVCQPDACAQGEKLVICDAACIIDSGNCSNGNAVAWVDKNLLCAQDGPTDLCKPECVFGQNEDIAYDNSCQMGLCAPQNPMMCGKYKCQGPACGTSCMSMDECKPGEKCMGGQCD
ncbi:MAG: hypothetical protein IPO88_30720 [Nannocystis sp.]|uniref:hypothetical protein n=1 Tax=Nannocystis sp. TaxID=1962667 RepID=UPI002421390B|nr:hypothetical protein [Nannocystis sp.]MBK9757808.1 hypothetical protein [Nannocystis sp.]